MEKRLTSRKGLLCLWKNSQEIGNKAKIEPDGWLHQSGSVGQQVQL